MFPDPTLEEARGHRPVRPALRQPGSSDWTAWVYTSREGLRALISDEVAVLEALAAARMAIQALPPD